MLEAKRVADLGVPAVILFGIPETKDARGSGADAANVARLLEEGFRDALTSAQAIGYKELVPVVEPASELRVVALRKLGDELVGVCHPGRIYHL